MLICSIVCESMEVPHALATLTRNHCMIYEPEIRGPCLVSHGRRVLWGSELQANQSTQQSAPILTERSGVVQWASPNCAARVSGAVTVLSKHTPNGAHKPRPESRCYRAIPFGKPIFIKGDIITLLERAVLLGWTLFTCRWHRDRLAHLPWTPYWRMKSIGRKSERDIYRTNISMQRNRAGLVSLVNELPVVWWNQCFLSVLSYCSHFLLSFTQHEQLISIGWQLYG